MMKRLLLLLTTVFVILTLTNVVISIEDSQTSDKPKGRALLVQRANLDVRYTESWFEFDGATGGWIIKDISRASDSGDVFPKGSPDDYGHRVQIITYDTKEEDMPYPREYEVLLKLPALNDEGEKCTFQDIATVSVSFEIEWEKWGNPIERNDFQIITYSDTDGFKQHKNGGSIAEILESAGVVQEGDIDPDSPDKTYMPTPLSEYPTPVIMTAVPKMYTPPSILEPFETFASFFTVMVTNWTLADGLPVSPVIARVHLLDRHGNIIRLKPYNSCSTCGEEICICPKPCSICGKEKCVCAQKQPIPQNDGWSFSKGVLTITTNRGTTAWRNGKGTSFKLNDVSSIAIQKSVTQIESNAFEGCRLLASITIPEGIKGIEELAFGGCTSLSAVTFKGMNPPDISYSAFRDTPKLTDIYVPEGAKKAYEAVEELRFYNIIETGVKPTGLCNYCKICKSGKPPIKGRVFGEDEPDIFDFIEILKYLVNIPECQLILCANALEAALITHESIITGEPTIFDGIEILKYIVGIEGEVPI